jgi:hypothetical protein
MCGMRLLSVAKCCVADQPNFPPRQAQVVELPARGPPVFEYDPEWLAILRSTHGVMNLNRQHRYAALHAPPAHHILNET